MSLTFQSLAALPSTSSVDGTMTVLVWTPEGYKNAPTDQIVTFSLGDLPSRVDALESSSGPSIWPTARTLSLVGPFTGSASFDGSADITLTITVPDGALPTTAVNGLATTLLNLQNSLGSKLDSGAAAVSANKWTTARAFTLAGPVTGTANVDGSGDVTLNVTIANNALSIAMVSGLSSALGALTPTASAWGAAGQDYNALTTSGFYRDGGGTNTNRPGTAYGQMLVVGSVDSVMQWYGSYSGNHYYARAASFPGGVFTWSSWVEFWHSGNLSFGSGLTLTNGVLTAAGASPPFNLTNGSTLASWVGGAYIYTGPGGGSIQISSTTSTANILGLMDYTNSVQLWVCDPNGNIVQNGGLSITGASAADIKRQWTTTPTSGLSLMGVSAGDTSYVSSIITFRASETWTTTAKGSYIQLRVTAPGTTTLAEVAAFSSTGLAVTGNVSATGSLTLNGKSLTIDGSGNLAFNVSVLYNNAGFSLAANGYYWTFGTDGSLTCPGNLSANGGVHSSQAIHALNNTAWNGQGAYMGWNRSGGQGETDFINHKGGGTGGWNFYNTDGTTYTALVTIDGTYGSIASPNGTVSGIRVFAGYDSGVNGAISCSQWFRSNGATGWYNATYGGGWYMTDATYVRSYQNKAVVASDFVISSDESLKVGIRPFEWRGRLEPIHFTVKETGEESFGFSANKVQLKYWEAVSVSSGDGTLKLSYPKLTAVLSYQVNMVEDAHAVTVERVQALESAAQLQLSQQAAKAAQEQVHRKRQARNSRRIVLLQNENRRLRDEVRAQTRRLDALSSQVETLLARTPWWKRLFGL